MINETMVELSRWQFAITSLYHFIFVPLTLGISWLIFIMELIYVKSGKTVYRDMTKFWGKLFGINFAIGVATGITLEFEFGTNWSNYSHYVGDIFGTPLAIEGLMAFFLESTFIGLFFTSWNRVSKVTHLVITGCTALGSNLSALWILVANGWMQYPEYATFSPERMRMEMTDFWGVVFSPVAQAKFAHTVSAGYITASVFVIGVSAYFLLNNRHIELAKRSMTIGITFCFLSMGGSAASGDMSALQITAHQPAKLAAMEAEYETQPAPASWSVFAIPNEAEMKNDFAIQVPWLLGFIATHTFDEQVPGLRDIVAQNEERIKNGSIAYNALKEMRADKSGQINEGNLALFNQYKEDLGYGMLLEKHAVDPSNPTEAEIKSAARDSVPPVWIAYFAFRAMLGLVSVIGIIVLGAAFFLWYKKDIERRKWLLKILVLSIPLPFLCCESGWILAEIGRQPWIIEGVLPTYLATSMLSVTDLMISLGFFILVYTIFLIIELTMMVKAIKKGPDETPAPQPANGGGVANAV